MPEGVSVGTNVGLGVLLPAVVSVVSVEGNNVGEMNTDVGTRVGCWVG